MKKQKALPLTETQKTFLETLISENKHYISNTVLNTLGSAFSFLYEDCISELYLLACLKISIAESHPNPDAWIIVCARLTAYTVMQQHRRNAVTAPLEEALPDGANVFDEALYNIWLENNAPLKLINTLAARERQVYNLIYIKGTKPEDVAKLLGISHSTVRNIRKQLKDKITDKVYKDI